MRKEPSYSLQQLFSLYGFSDEEVREEFNKFLDKMIKLLNKEKGKSMLNSLIVDASMHRIGKEAKENLDKAFCIGILEKEERIKNMH